MEIYSPKKDAKLGERMINRKEQKKSHFASYAKVNKKFEREYTEIFPDDNINQLKHQLLTQENLDDEAEIFDKKIDVLGEDELSGFQPSTEKSDLSNLSRSNKSSVKNSKSSSENFILTPNTKMRRKLCHFSETSIPIIQCETRNNIFRSMESRPKEALPKRILLR